MLRTFVDVAQAVKPTNHYSTFKGVTSVRAYSINTAIYRGIRKSRARPREERPAYPNSETHNRDGPFSERSRQDDWASTRIRRPNHQARQDVEDMEESARRKEDRLTPRQKNYLRGGRRDTPTGSSSLQNSPDRFSQPSSYRDRSPSDKTERTGRYPDAKRHVNGAYGSDRPKNSGRSLGYREFDEGRPKDYSHQEQRFERPHEDYRQASNKDSSEEGRQPGEDTTVEMEDVSSEPFSKEDRTRYSEERRRYGPKAPLSIPYTTAASEFLYGASVVIAALKTARRKLYKIYLYKGVNRDVANQDKLVVQLAHSRGLEVTKVEDDWLRLMDKMSGGRPHNGYILEASPLPKLPVTAFKPVEGPQKPFLVTLDYQSHEDSKVNGRNSTIKYSVGFPRYPIVLLLDGILDPGNLGAILRTAYFLGIDAVAISNRNSAPLTPVTLKASAGASESVPLLSISHPGAFIDESQKNGWKFYAAVASSTNSTEQPRLTISNINSPSRKHPCVLMLGGEGEGLRWNLQKKADFLLSIEGQRSGQGGVDSLNVSVAAGLLCEAFLRKPAKDVKGNTKTAPAEKVAIGEEALF